MKYALNLGEDGRVLSATFCEFAQKDACLTEALPDGNIAEYRYEDGVFVHDPLPKPETPEKTETDIEKRISALEEELAAAKILLGVE